MLNFLNPGDEVEDETLILPPFHCKKNMSKETHTEKQWSREYKYNLEDFNEMTCGNNIRDIYHERKKLRKEQNKDRKPEFTHWNEELNFDYRTLKKMKLTGNMANNRLRGFRFHGERLIFREAILQRLLQLHHQAQPLAQEPLPLDKPLPSNIQMALGRSQRKTPKKTRNQTPIKTPGRPARPIKSQLQHAPVKGFRRQTKANDLQFTPSKSKQRIEQPDQHRCQCEQQTRSED